MPVHWLNSFQDFCSESDSGLMIDANIVTVVPEWPAYAWYLAQFPVRVCDEPPPLVGLLPHAASTVRAAIAGAKDKSPLRRLRTLMSQSSNVEMFTWLADLPRQARPQPSRDHSLAGPGPAVNDALQRTR